MPDSLLGTWKQSQGLTVLSIRSRHADILAQPEGCSDGKCVQTLRIRDIAKLEQGDLLCLRSHPCLLLVPRLSKVYNTHHSSIHVHACNTTVLEFEQTVFSFLSIQPSKLVPLSTVEIKEFMLRKLKTFKQ
jgi:hypothetical protein